MSTVSGPARQTTIGYATSAESPRADTTGAPSRSIGSGASQSAGRSVPPAGTATVRETQTVSPTVGAGVCARPTLIRG